MPVGVMLRSMTREELQEWLEFFKLEDEDRKRQELADAAVRGVEARVRR